MIELSWGSLYQTIYRTVPDAFTPEQNAKMTAAMGMGSVNELVADDAVLRQNFVRALDDPRVAAALQEHATAFRVLVAGRDIPESVNFWDDVHTRQAQSDPQALSRTGLTYMRARRGSALMRVTRSLTPAGFLATRQDAITRAMTRDADLRAAVKDLVLFMSTRPDAGDLLAKVREFFPVPRKGLPLELNQGIRLAHAVTHLPDAWRTRAETFLATAIATITAVMQKRFIIGTDAISAWRSAAEILDQGGTVIFDVLGESVSTIEQADAFVQHYLDLINAPSDDADDEVVHVNSTLDPDASQLNALFMEGTTGTGYTRQGVPMAYLLRERSMVRAMRSSSPVQFSTDYQADFQVAIKFSMLTPLWESSKNSLETATAVKMRLRRVLDEILDKQEKSGLKIGLTVDLEHYWCRDFTYSIFKQVMMEDKYRHMQNVGIVVQAYYRDAGSIISDLATWSRTRGGSISIRLVKGAYYPYEVEVAQAEGRPSPVFVSDDGSSSQWMTDLNYERMVDLLARNRDALRLMAASHNPRVHSYVSVVRARHAMPFERQMLAGIEDGGKRAFYRAGDNLAVYGPVDPEGTGGPYMTRRFDETATGNVLVRLADPSIPDADFLQDPAHGHDVSAYDRSVSDFNDWRASQVSVDAAAASVAESVMAGGSIAAGVTPVVRPIPR